MSIQSSEVLTGLYIVEYFLFSEAETNAANARAQHKVNYQALHYGAGVGTAPYYGVPGTDLKGVHNNGYHGAAYGNHGAYNGGYNGGYNGAQHGGYAQHNSGYAQHNAGYGHGYGAQHGGYHGGYAGNAIH